MWKLGLVLSLALCAVARPVLDQTSLHTERNVVAGLGITAENALVRRAG